MYKTIWVVCMVWFIALVVKSRHLLIEKFLDLLFQICFVPTWTQSLDLSVFWVPWSVPVIRSLKYILFFQNIPLIHMFLLFDTNQAISWYKLDCDLKFKLFSSKEFDCLLCNYLSYFRSVLFQECFVFFGFQNIFSSSLTKITEHFYTEQFKSEKN